MHKFPFASATSAEATEALEYAHEVVELARKEGASQAEATLSIADRFSAEARDRSITKLEQSTGRSLHMRVFVDGRKASLTTSDFDREQLREAVASAVAQARHVAYDPFALLPEQGDQDTPDSSGLRLYSEELAERDAQAEDRRSARAGTSHS